VFLLSTAVAFAQDQSVQSQNPFDNLSGALSTEDTRLTTGIESVAASAATGQQHLLIDFMLTAPIGQAVTRTHKPAATAWLNARFNGAASNAVSGVKQFVGGFEKELVSGDTANLLSSLAFRAGLEFRLGKRANFEFRTRDFQFQPTFIAAIGVQTVPALKSPAIFDLPAHTDSPTDKFSNLPYERWGIPIDKGYKYVSLGEPDRRRFYKSFELGLRLKTHHFEDCQPPAEPDCSRDNRVNFPGIIDLTLGQDASITGGTRRGIVGRVDAFYPLPSDNLANAIYLFGAVRVHWVKGVNIEEDPVILRAPTASVTLPSAEVFEHTLTPDERTRDEWKFGLGVDLVRLFTAATDQRNKDDAGQEDGSIQVLDENPDAIVMRRVIQPGETRTFNIGADMLISKTPAAVDVSPPVKEGSKINFVADEVKLLEAGRYKLHNGTVADVGVVVIRVKPGEAKGAFPTGRMSEQLVKQESRYRLSTVDCTAKCDFTFDASIDNTVVILPLSKAAMTIGTEKVEKEAYQPVVVARKKAIDLADSKAKFVVVRIR
jgi:hypothetical protein